ncbi:glycosyl hydrolase family 28-related protein [Gordonia amicalis]
MDVSRRSALLGIVGLGSVSAAVGCSLSSDGVTKVPGSADTVPTPRFINVRDFGAVGDGKHDDTDAIDSALRSIDEDSSQTGVILYFPVGRYVDSGTHVLGQGRPHAICGAGPGLSVLLRSGSAADAWWDLRSAFCRVSGVTLNSRRATGESAAVAVNGSYITVDNVHFEDSPATALAIGPAKTAIGCVLDGLQFRYSGKHHVHVIGRHSSSDGRWSNIEAGISGLSGVRVESAAQNIVNLHVWGAGTVSSSSNAGIEILSSNNSLGAGWQSEKNLGVGLIVQGSYNVISGGRSWGNVGLGISLNGGSGNIVSSNVFRDNSIGAEVGSRERIVAKIVGDSVLFSQNVFTQTNDILSPTSYREVPRYSYPGRSVVTGPRPASASVMLDGDIDTARFAASNIGASAI